MPCVCHLAAQPHDVSRFFEELDFQQTPLGELSLRRKRLAVLGDRDIFEVKLGEGFLMSSLFHAVEDAVANLGLKELTGGNWDIVVGGLGLGYTALAALEHAAVRSLLVVEMLEPVIGWHRSGLVPLGPKLTGDPRCRIQQGDFFALARSATGFDGGRQFDAVLLDIDHSPRHLLTSENARFYSRAGLSELARHIRPGGVFSMWSDDAPDEGFLAPLREVFATARSEIVSFPNPLLGRDSASTVYLATKA